MPEAAFGSCSRRKGDGGLTVAATSPITAAARQGFLEGTAAARPRGIMGRRAAVALPERRRPSASALQMGRDEPT